MSKQADVHITRWLTALINCTAPWTINDLALLRKASTSVKYQFFRIFTDNLQSVQKQRFWGKGSSLPLKSGKFYRSITLDSPIAAFIFGLLLLLPGIKEDLATRCLVDKDRVCSPLDQDHGPLGLSHTPLVQSRTQC